MSSGRGKDRCGVSTDSPRNPAEIRQLEVFVEFHLCAEQRRTGLAKILAVEFRIRCIIVARVSGDGQFLSSQLFAFLQTHGSSRAFRTVDGLSIGSPRMMVLIISRRTGHSLESCRAVAWRSLDIFRSSRLLSRCRSAALRVRPRVRRRSKMIR